MARESGGVKSKDCHVAPEPVEQKAVSVIANAVQLWFTIHETRPARESDLNLQVMSKWTKPRRDPGRVYADDAQIELRRTAKARIDEFVAIGLEAETLFVRLLKSLEKDITPERLRERIKQFRAAVYERQQLDGRGR